MRTLEQIAADMDYGQAAMWLGKRYATLRKLRSLNAPDIIIEKQEEMVNTALVVYDICRQRDIQQGPLMRIRSQKQPPNAVENYYPPPNR